MREEIKTNTGGGEGAKERLLSLQSPCISAARGRGHFALNNN